jgi:type IV secretion system protein TrbG
MIKMIFAAGALLLGPALAAAEGWSARVEGVDASAGDRKAPPPRLDPLAGPQAPLTRKERRGVAYGRQWADNPDMPACGEDGSVVFIFGATLPTVVCAPLHVCDLVLQAGETVNDLNAGDSVRWQITPATQGTGEASITHVIVKPTDIGLTTNRRAYTIKLVSRAEEWMPRVSFHYLDDMRAVWSAYRQGVNAQGQAALASAAAAGGAADFDFGYALSGDSPAWRPVRVFANGAKTYIELPSDIGSATCRPSSRSAMMAGCSPSPRSSWSTTASSMAASRWIACSPARR